MDILDAAIGQPTNDMALDEFKKDLVYLVFRTQRIFCEKIENLERSKTFTENKWKAENGFGQMNILEHDDGIFEKVGVCASVSQGTLPFSAYFILNDSNVQVPLQNVSHNPTFFTVGLTGVTFPKNPNIPTLNFSYHYFEINYGDNRVWWFGGGSDLTPYILHVEDCEFFHTFLKTICDKFDKSYYNSFKRKSDEHFCLKHRGERRGIGGIFFENLNDPNKNICSEFFSECLSSIIPCYVPIVMKNRYKKFDSDDIEWQNLLRARSVEFSLIYDKATEFMLRLPDFCHENILMTLPPSAKWQYDYNPKEESKEYELLKIMRCPREWV